MTNRHFLNILKIDCQPRIAQLTLKENGCVSTNVRQRLSDWHDVTTAQRRHDSLSPGRVVQLSFGVHTGASARLPHEVQGEQGQGFGLRGGECGRRSDVRVRSERCSDLLSGLPAIPGADARLHNRCRCSQEDIDHPNHRHGRTVQRYPQWQGPRRPGLDMLQWPGG